MPAAKRGFSRPTLTSRWQGNRFELLSEESAAARAKPAFVLGPSLLLTAACDETRRFHGGAREGDAASADADAAADAYYAREAAAAAAGGGARASASPPRQAGDDARTLPSQKRRAPHGVAPSRWSPPQREHPCSTACANQQRDRLSAGRRHLRATSARVLWS